LRVANGEKAAHAAVDLMAALGMAWPLLDFGQTLAEVEQVLEQVADPIRRICGL
jgi:hypothetical protein